MPRLSDDGQFFTSEGDYKGLYRGWKCRVLYTVEIESGKMTFLPANGR